MVVEPGTRVNIPSHCFMDSELRLQRFRDCSEVQPSNIPAMFTASAV